MDTDLQPAPPPPPKTSTRIHKNNNIKEADSLSRCKTLANPSQLKKHDRVMLYVLEGHFPKELGTCLVISNHLDGNEGKTISHTKALKIFIKKK